MEIFKRAYSLAFLAIAGAFAIAFAGISIYSNSWRHGDNLFASGLASASSPQDVASQQGMAGRLHLYDSNNQDLGILLDVGTVGEQFSCRGPSPTPCSVIETSIFEWETKHDWYRTYLPNFQIILEFSESARYATSTGPSYTAAPARVKPYTSISGAAYLVPFITSLAPELISYTGPNCTGQSFRRLAPHNYLVRGYATTSPRDFKVAKGLQWLVSASEFTANGCQNVSRSMFGSLLKPITLPFSEPLAWPLSIRPSR